MSQGRKQAFEYICQHAFTMRLVVYGGTVALLLEAVALLTLEPGSGSYTVALLNLPGLLFFMLLAVLTWRKCASYQ
jgi:hypothetical protein